MVMVVVVVAAVSVFLGSGIPVSDVIDPFHDL